MQFRKDKTGYWLILDKGEEVKSTIEDWAKKEKITGAAISGIGAVTDVELAAYNPDTNEWHSKKLTDYYEMLSCIGNITTDGVHAHLVLGTQEFGVIGGHLKSAKISALGEFFIIPSEKVEKFSLPGTKLKKIDLGK